MMLKVFLSTLPIFLLVFTGFLIRRFFVQNEEFWRVAEKLTYFLFFPVLLVLMISKANFSISDASSAVAATVCSTLIIAAIIFMLRLIVDVKDDLFTSIFQGGIRYNSYIFIALSQSLYGETGISLSGIFVAYMIVLTNVMSVMVMNQYGSGKKKKITSILIVFLKNPLILGSILGLAINSLDVELTGAITDYLHYLADAATPLSLLSVGAGLSLSMKHQKVTATAYTSILKLVLMPICTAMILSLVGSVGTAANIALLYSAVPCAGNAYILSRQMGGDSETMASITTWTTLLSIVTISCMIEIFHF